jgi:hypothetical protein
MTTQYEMTGSIEAMQVDGDNRDADTDERGAPEGMLAVAAWIGSQVTVNHDRHYEVEVPLGRHGWVYARPGDWVVKLREDVFIIVDAVTFEQFFAPAP